MVSPVSHYLGYFEGEEIAFKYGRKVSHYRYTEMRMPLTLVQCKPIIGTT